MCLKAARRAVRMLLLPYICRTNEHEIDRHLSCFPLVYLLMAMTIAREQRTNGLTVLCLEGSLRAPIGPELQQRVEALLRRGDRLILLDLACIALVDAAGVGELAQLYRTAAAASAALQITRAAGMVRELLDLAGLFEPLNADSVFDYERCS
jgi:anti-anti-sigma factor